jgi:hypothetical protein
MGFDCHSFIHIGPFTVLTCCGSFQIISGPGYFAPAKQLKPDLRVFLFIVRSFLKDCRNLFVSIFFFFLREICVLVTRLAFSGKRLHQIFLSPGTF